MKTSLLLLLLFSWCMLSAQKIDTAKQCALQAYVIDKNSGSPLDTAEVTIYTSDKDSIVGSSVTNAAGYSSFIILPKGKYYVNVTREPYQSTVMYFYSSWYKQSGKFTLTFKLADKPSGPLHDADGHQMIIR